MATRSGVSVTGANANHTVGATSGTPFKGIGAGRTGGYTWGTSADTLTLSGNADFVSLGTSTLTVAAKVVGGARRRHRHQARQRHRQTDQRRQHASPRTTSPSNRARCNTPTAPTLTFPAAVKFNVNPTPRCNSTTASPPRSTAPSSTTATSSSRPVSRVRSSSKAVPSPAAESCSARIRRRTTAVRRTSSRQPPPKSWPTRFCSTTAKPTPSAAWAVSIPSTRPRFSPSTAPTHPSTSPATGTATAPIKSVGSSSTMAPKSSSTPRPQLDTISDTGALRSFAGRGDGTGVVEFADGFVAN